MAICSECKREYISLKEEDECCPGCKAKRAGKKHGEVQDKHLQEKQKRFTSE